MPSAYLCEGLRTPIGRYAGALSSIRPDDLLAMTLRAVCASVPGFDTTAVDDVIIGCANQAGEDNRNIARMSALLAGFDHTVGGVTVNRLCASGLEAVAMAARSIQAGDAEMIVAGGVESMSRAPMVIPKPDAAFSRRAEMFDTTLGWRFINPKMQSLYGTDSMPETAENLAEDYKILRVHQDEYALRSQQRAAAAIARGRFSAEITSVSVAQRKGPAVIVSADEHPRATQIEQLAGLPTPFRKAGTVTAGNASGMNDGAAAMIIASAAAIEKHSLTPKARILGTAIAGVPPRIMGIGPAPATVKLLGRLDLTIDDIDIIELNEAFAAQAIAVLRELGIDEDATHVNPNGGAIALGHPLGMSGARIALSAANELQSRGLRRALCTMCIGVGQGIALLMEAV